jgi:hypothetical protein
LAAFDAATSIKHFKSFSIGPGIWFSPDLNRRLCRTVSTGLGKLDVAPRTAEAVLNHLPPKLIRTYDRNTYLPEKRAALEQWTTHLKTIVAQATGANVTALRKGDSVAGKKR